jgi:hypothetical protein
MDSDNEIFSENGFSEWKKLSNEVIRDLPTKTGVYVLRLHNGVRFGRLKGDSDIIKIGEGEIDDRMLRYLDLAGSIGETAERIINAMDMWGYEFDISWKMCDKEDAQNLEKRLLEKYKEEHHELPPFNLQEK